MPVDTGHQHLRNLSRWDRIPMNTFRRTRSDVALPTMSHMTMSLPVGIGYGLKSPSAGAWWDQEGKKRGGKRERTASASASASLHAMLALSPVLFPVRGGSDELHHHAHHQTSQLKIHRDKERRKRKSKTVDSAAVKPIKRPIHAQRASSLVNVPPLRI